MDVVILVVSGGIDDGKKKHSITTLTRLATINRRLGINNTIRMDWEQNQHQKSSSVTIASDSNVKKQHHTTFIIASAAARLCYIMAASTSVFTVCPGNGRFLS